MGHHPEEMSHQVLEDTVEVEEEVHMAQENEASLNRLPAVWFQADDILEKTQLQRQ